MLGYNITRPGTKRAQSARKRNSQNGHARPTGRGKGNFRYLVPDKRCARLGALLGPENRCCIIVALGDFYLFRTRFRTNSLASGHVKAWISKYRLFNLEQSTRQIGPGVKRAEVRRIVAPGDKPRWDGRITIWLYKRPLIDLICLYILQPMVR